MQHPFEGILDSTSRLPAKAPPTDGAQVTRRTWFTALARAVAAILGILGMGAGSAMAQTWYYRSPRYRYHRPRSYRGWYQRRWPHHQVTTYALGEEGSGRVTTYALGEEGGGTHNPPSDGGRYTTYALGEEGSGTHHPPSDGGRYTTYALGEEGSGGGYTTQALGEEGGFR